VNVFMDASFDAVKRDIILLQVKLRSMQNKIVAKKTTLLAAERVGLVTAQQCEASLQVLQFLCIPQAFRDKVLAHKVFGSFFSLMSFFNYLCLLSAN
jgi:hypothetical protein